MSRTGESVVGMEIYSWRKTESSHGNSADFLGFEEQRFRKRREEIAVGRGNFDCDGGDVAEARLGETHTIRERREPLPRAPQRFEVAIETEQTNSVIRPAQHRLRVTTHTHRPVDDPARAARSQKERDLVDEDWNVNC